MGYANLVYMVCTNATDYGIYYIVNIGLTILIVIENTGAVMNAVIEINDLSCPDLDIFTRLTEAQLRNAFEPERGIFIAESAKVIALALDAGYEPISFLMERRHISGQARGILARCANVPVYTGESGLLAELTGFPLTRGVLCAFRRPPISGLEEICANARRVAILEDITDSTNVGALFRSAAALNIDAVLLTPSCCDPLCRRAVRVSMGAVLQTPWTRIGSEPSSWPKQGLELLRKLGFKTVAMVLNHPTVRMDDPELIAQEKLAILFGTEGDGLKADTVASCDYTTCIPMSHNIDSLNVAAASAIAFWQFVPRSQAPQAPAAGES